MASIKIKTASSNASRQDLSMLFGAAGMAPANVTEMVQQVQISLLDSHPKQGRWHMAEDEINWLANNIAQNGILQPLSVMKKPDGRYLLLAGHKRTEAARRAGLTVVPAMVEPYDERRGDIIFNATNLGNREKLLPSEKAWAYADLEDDCRAGNKTTAALAELTGDNVRMIQRFKRLTQLIPQLIELVDADTIPLFAGVDLSYLTAEEQQCLVKVLNYHGSKIISLKQAHELKERAARAALAKAEIEDVLFPTRPSRTSKPTVFKLKISDYGGYIPEYYNQNQVHDLIQAALVFYAKNKCDDSSHPLEE